MNATSRADLASYPELSWPAVILGAGIGTLLTSAFVYIALKLGFGLAGSSVAAIAGFAVLRGVLRRRSIVENNINQTVASGINTASAGVVFTLPALMLMSVDDPSLAQFPLVPLVVAAVAGSLMGIVLIIPLRKQMVELERLKFPSGVATATLLRSPGEGVRQATLLAVGGLVGLLLTVLVNLGALPGDFDLGGLVGLPAWAPLALYVSAANFGAGLLSGRGGLPFAVGGILAWWVISPVAATTSDLALPSGGSVPTDVLIAGEVYGQMLRPLGIGLLIGGALAGVVAAFPAVRAALSSLAAAARAAAATGGTADELSPNFLGGAATVGFLALLFATYTAAPALGPGRTLLIAVVGAVWLGLAGVIVAQATGATDISPLSGLSLIAVTLMFFLTGGDVTASILIGLAVCVAINQCADMMSDLKTGHLVGARPRDQQLAQVLLCWLGPLVAIGVLWLLWYAPGDGTPGFGPASVACLNQTADCLSAPQASALASTLDALRSADAPVDKYLAGAGLGAALSVFPIGGVAVLVGLAMYLPFSITLAYGLGCVVSMRMEQRLGSRFIGSSLVPFAAGLIVGEALTQLGWSLVTVGAPLLGGGA